MKTYPTNCDPCGVQITPPPPHIGKRGEAYNTVTLEYAGNLSVSKWELCDTCRQKLLTFMERKNEK